MFKIGPAAHVSSLLVLKMEHSESTYTLRMDGEVHQKAYRNVPGRGWYH